MDQACDTPEMSRAEGAGQRKEGQRRRRAVMRDLQRNLNH